MFLQKRTINPKNIRARIALSVNGAVIHVVRYVVDPATVERRTIIPRQHAARLENRVKKGDSTPLQIANEIDQPLL